MLLPFALIAHFAFIYFSTVFLYLQWSLVTGAWVGLMYVFIFFFGYLYQHPSAAPVNAGITGLILNCVASIVTEILFYRHNKLHLRKQPSLFSTTETEKHTNSAKERGLVGRPDWDHPCIARFGEKPLTAGLLNLMMKGFPEREFTIHYMFSTAVPELASTCCNFRFICFVHRNAFRDLHFGLINILSLIVTCKTLSLSSRLVQPFLSCGCEYCHAFRGVWSRSTDYPR